MHALLARFSSFACLVCLAGFFLASTAEADSQDTSEGRGLTAENLTLVNRNELESLKLIIRRMLEIDIFCNNLDKEISDALEIRGYLSFKGRKALKKNTYASLFSAVSRGCVVGSFDLSYLGEIPERVTGGVDLGDGVFQLLLGYRSLKDQKHVSREMTRESLILKAMLLGDNRGGVFPAEIWRFLTEKSGAGDSKRDFLIQRWKASHLIRSQCKGPVSMEDLLCKVCSSYEGKLGNSYADIRIAMLYDIKCQVRLEKIRLLAEVH